MILRLALCAGLVAAAACGDVVRTVKQTLAAGKALERQIDRYSPDDETRTRLRRIAQRGQGDSVNLLVQQGLPRLDSTSLIRRVELLGQMLGSADERVCAALARGNPSEVQMTVALGGLDSAALDDWMGVLAKSMVAAVQNHAAPGVGQDEVSDAIQSVLERLPAEESERLVNGLGAIDRASDADACWTGRVLYREVVALAEPERGTLARGLVQP